MLHIRAPPGFSARRKPESEIPVTMLTMKFFLLLCLCCAPVLGADSGLQVITTAKTNAPTGSISMKDVFTRNGQTNLVRDTRIMGGKVQIRLHRFYHGGSLVGSWVASPDASSTTSEAGASCAVDFEYGAAGELKYAALQGKDGGLLDLFTCSNGLLSPVGNLELSNAVQTGTSAKELMSHAREGTPEEFRRATEEMIKKHKDK